MKDMVTKDMRNDQLDDLFNVKASGKMGERYSSFLPQIASSTPKINKIEWLKGEHFDVVPGSEDEVNGFVQFKTPLWSCGLTLFDLNTYKKEIFSNFIVDFMGELIVRCNLNLFLNEMLTLKEDAYVSAISGRDHHRFGMKFNADTEELVFTFHISLIQNIMTEHFKDF